MLFAQRYAFNQDYAVGVYGREQAREGKLRGVVEACRKLGATIDDAVRMIMEDFGLSQEAALKQVHKIWRKLADKED